MGNQSDMQDRADPAVRHKLPFRDSAFRRLSYSFYSPKGTRFFATEDWKFESISVQRRGANRAAVVILRRVLIAIAIG
jgi:hypothetical protein